MMEEMVTWLQARIAETRKCRDAVNHELSPRAYGYWQGQHEAYQYALRKLVGTHNDSCMDSCMLPTGHKGGCIPSLHAE